LSDTDGVAVLDAGAALVTGAEPGVIRVTGVDRASWLQGVVTNDVAALAPGRGCYSAWLTPQGRMITDAIVLAEEDALTLQVPRPLSDDVYRRLDAAIFAEQVLVTDEGGVWSSVGVHGARAADIVARMLLSVKGADPGVNGAALAAWPEYASSPLGDAGRLFRHDRYGHPGFEARVPRADADGWTARLRLAGGVVTDAEALEFARIEAGRPVFLIDMDDDTIPLEAGIEDRAISFTKGCYVGQEVIVRVVHRGGGRVARRLVGLEIQGRVPPGSGAVVRHDLREIGRVTSAAWSPRAHAVVALGTVARAYAEPGSTVAVDCADVWTPATVRALPMR
jgi:tRNA-modifying protein YgfZ